MALKYAKNPVKILVERGFVLEINRKLLHPLGLAMAVDWPDTPEEKAAAETGETVTVRLWDCQDDPEGILFDDDALMVERRESLEATLTEAAPRLKTRRDLLGYVVQGEPLDDLALRAYTAYGASTGGVNFRGEPMPTWGALPEPIKQAWREASAAITGLAGLGRV